MSEQAVTRGPRLGLPRLHLRIEHPLRTIRDERELTQADVSDLSGISRASIARIESGDHVKVSTLRAIADALDVPLEALTAVKQAAIAVSRDELAEILNGRETQCACSLPAGTREFIATRLGIAADDDEAIAEFVNELHEAVGS